MNNRFEYSTKGIMDFNVAIDQFGWAVYENVLHSEEVDEINDSLEDAYHFRRQIQIENGIGANTDGTLHHLISQDNFAMRFLNKNCFDAEIKQFLKGQYIVNAFGAVINSKDVRQYVQRIHRDVRSFTGNLKMMIQMIVLLDDFTEDNGATYFLSGSHKKDEQPDERYFYDNAVRAIAKKGSVILFDSNLWHAAGWNYTDKKRRALTVGFTPPFIKQQFDYPRNLGYEYGDGLNGVLRQVLGYKSRVPDSLYDYYQPTHKRMYQPDQG